MPEEYLLMEYKHIQNDCLVALPISLYTNSIENAFYAAGVLHGITDEDFQKNPEFGHLYLPFQTVGTISYPDEKTTKDIQKGLEKICVDNSFDPKLIHDEKLTSNISDYEIVEGDIYVVRFTGLDLVNETTMVRSFAYFLNPEDGNINVKDNQPALNDEPITLPKGDLNFLLKYDGVEGQLESFKAGTAKVHRKVLNPYLPKDSAYDNSPGIINLKFSPRVHEFFR